jgi:predicted phage baseplate assembly protein
MSEQRDNCTRQGIYDTPQSLENRAGLDQLRYRVGSFSSFRRTMLRRIPRIQIEADGQTIAAPLRTWSARDSDDYGIALIELWAYVADILTFYQERIANEAFIRTARQRASLVRLANLLNYQPAPGVAASAYMIFQMKDSSLAQIRAGFPLQHVPVAEEKPQTFETSDRLVAQAIWNKFTPQPDQPQPVTFHIDQTTTRLAGARARIAVGDWVLIMGAQRANAVPGSDEAGSEGYEVRQVIAVERLPEADETRITFDLPLGTRIFGHEIVVETVADLYVFRGQGALFGSNAPDWRSIGALAAFEYLSDAQRTEVNDAHDPTSTEPGAQAAYLRAVAAKVREQGDWHNQETDLGTRTLDLDRIYPAVVKDSWVVMMSGGYREVYKVVGVETAGRSDYTRTAQVSRLTVDTDENFDNYGLAEGEPFDKVRGTIVLLNTEQLALAQDTIPTFIEGITIAVVEDASTLQQGHLLMVYGETESAGIQGEVVVVKETRSTPTPTIVLVDGLTHRYVRAATTIFANVVAATHGETVAGEILGNGDPSIAFQSFELKQSPLTYVPRAGAPNGAAPTLELRVNGVRWQHVPGFYGRASDEAIYTISMTDEQGTVVRLGNGTTGALPSSGRNNITATYRKGIGKDGNLPAGVIKTPLERPKGLKKAYNPLPASGGAEPEDAASIRKNAPNTVRTFGRIVSLRDFEDAAREFAGVAKARAFIEWDREWQSVKLIIAGDDGAMLVGQSYETLVADLNSRRDPNRRLRVLNYCPVDVQLSLQVHSDPAYLPEDVLANVTAALEEFFAFANLNLGQTIALSEVYYVIHSADGVVGAEITRFRIDPDSPHGCEATTTPFVHPTEPLQQVLRIRPYELARLDTGALAMFQIEHVGEA